MTRILVLLIFTIPIFDSFGQSGACICEKINVIPENQYKCDTTYFSNGYMLYWQWNCDSAWLTFENKSRLILTSWAEMDVYSCQRTGLNFLKEYPQYLLFQYKWISGCCTPPNVIFLSKETGKELRRIVKTQFINGDIDKNYILHFSDTSFSELTYLDNMTDKEYSIKFQSNEVIYSATKNQILELTDLFRNYEIKDNQLTFDFKQSNGNWTSMKIEIK